MKVSEQDTFESSSSSSSFSEDSSCASSTESRSNGSSSTSSKMDVDKKKGVLPVSQLCVGERKTAETHSILFSATGASTNAGTNATTTTAAFSVPQNVQLTSVRRVRLNPELRFEQSDVSWIDVPPNSGNVLRLIATNYDMFSEGQYRVVDYLRTAVELFITEVRHEYMLQYQQAQKNGRCLTRFTWRNKGELAICFAVCCDMLKLLYDRLRPGPEKIVWESFVNQFIVFLMTESRIPENILSEQTYHIKFLDWRKGGTRYQGGQLVSNVRFPSAEERRLKIETYIRSGASYNIESTEVDVPLVAPSAFTVSGGSSEPSTADSRTKLAGSVVCGGPIPPLVGFPRGQPPVKMPGKLQVKAPPALIAGKQAVDEYRHLGWLARLTQITGATSTLEFPKERSHMILAFVRFCETSEMPDHFVTIMNILINSSVEIQDAFERGGGIVVLRSFVDTLVRLKNAEGLISILEQILRMKLSSWGSSSKQSWLRDLKGTKGSNLRWLRALQIIPADRQTTWNTLVSSLERRYVLSKSREEKEVQLGAKRARIGAEEALRMSMADNIGVSKPVKHISTALCVSLPGKFSAPPLSSGLEHDTISFLNKKLKLCEEAQVSWREAILKALNGKCQGLQIPLWYDPYQLLGVDPHPST